MITINNWSKHQHYKNRKPPWIKLYRDLLDDIEYRQLSDSAARLLIDLWLIASETNSGEINLDIKTLAWRLRDASKTIANYSEFLKELNKQSFISVDSDMLAECKQDAIPEREGETEGEREKKTISSSVDEGEVYITKKKRKLNGMQLTWFNRFWSSFSYAKGKAEAADAWLDLKVTERMSAEIIAGATAEASGRSAVLEDNRTPKMAQGWLSGRRWEDGDGGIADTVPWYKTAPGIKAKGLEYGIKEDDYDMFPDFRAAVLEAAKKEMSCTTQN
jgi:hypothetical protein